MVTIVVEGDGTMYNFSVIASLMRTF